jgi:hypothetical protein
MAVPELDHRVLAQVVARVRRADYPAWAAQLAGAGNCSHPVRLRGKITTTDATTGEHQVVFTTSDQPDRVLLKACGSRRATRCPACAALYRSDARALILAGLLGGKGVDPTVADHPLVFITLTAPSFGTVHVPAGDDDRICRTTASRFRCQHGRPRGCNDRHAADDERIGQPLCIDCYDFAGAVVWNARSPELWRRTTIAMQRRLAGAAGLTVRELREHQTLAFVKVAEYQRRGLVHFHGLVRIDPVDNDRPLDLELVSTAVAAVLPRVRAANPWRPTRPIRWGPQCAVIPLPSGDRPSVAAYLAKYATKSVDTGGALDHRLHDGDLSNYPLPDHLRLLAETAWDLGGDPSLVDLNLRFWAHTLGYRGHWLTKSRTWSTTLTRLRSDRHQWQLARHGITQTEEHSVRAGEWTYEGTGHTTDGDTWLAVTANRNRQHDRRIAWEER